MIFQMAPLQSQGLLTQYLLSTLKTNWTSFSCCFQESDHFKPMKQPMKQNSFSIPTHTLFLAPLPPLSSSSIKFLTSKFAFSSFHIYFKVFRWQKANSLNLIFPYICVVHTHFSGKMSRHSPQNFIVCIFFSLILFRAL